MIIVTFSFTSKSNDQQCNLKANRMNLAFPKYNHEKICLEIFLKKYISFKEL